MYMDGKIGKIARLFFKLTRRIEREDSLKFREKELRLNSAKGNKASQSSGRFRFRYIGNFIFPVSSRPFSSRIFFLRRDGDTMVNTTSTKCYIKILDNSRF